MKVMKGLNGWLFLDNDTNEVVEQITGKKEISSEEWNHVADILDKRKKLSKIYGFQYLYLIVPNSHCFASENLPKHIVVSNHRSSIYMQNHFSDVVVYPLDLLLSKKKQYTLYYKTDTHWTDLGAAVVFNELSNRLDLNTVIDVDGEKEIVTGFAGDLGSQLSPVQTSEFQRLILDCGVTTVFDNKANLGSLGHYVHVKSKNKNCKKCIIFGDSYTYFSLSTIGYYFQDVYFFWCANAFDFYIIEKLRPDVVISETSERCFNGIFDERSHYEILVDKLISGQYDTVESLYNIDLQDNEVYSQSFQNWFSVHKEHINKINKYDRGCKESESKKQKSRFSQPNVLDTEKQIQKEDPMPMMTRETIHTLLEKKKVLEIGPWCKPFIKHEGVKYLDAFSLEDLIKRAREFGQDPKDAPTKIDYVITDDDWTVIDEKFEAVFSSHSIEHQQDFITHLQNVSSVLEKNGSYFACIPDKRYCLNHFNQITTVGDIVDTHYRMQKNKDMSFETYVSGHLFVSNNDPMRHWNHDHGDLVWSDTYIEKLFREFQEYSGKYLDLHRWFFTPNSFYINTALLYTLGFTDLFPVIVTDTMKNFHEFYTQLVKMDTDVELSVSIAKYLADDVD